MSKNIKEVTRTVMIIAVRKRPRQEIDQKALVPIIIILLNDRSLVGMLERPCTQIDK